MSWIQFTQKVFCRPYELQTGVDCYRLLGVLTTGCSYGSMYEAREACDEWVRKGVKYKMTYSIGGIGYSSDNYNRSCDDEPATKKILGFENKEIESGKIYNSREVPGWNDLPVTKRLKY